MLVHNENSRRFLIGSGTGIVAASLALGLTVSTAPATETSGDADRAANVQALVGTSVPSASPTGPRSTPSITPTSPAAKAQTTQPPGRPAAKPQPAATALPRPSTPAAKQKPPAAPLRARATARPSPAKAPAKPSVRQSGPTSWTALNAAIARIPGYRQGAIRWSVTDRYGHYGTTDLATSAIYISPGVPVGLLDSVVRHEYAHVVSVRAYGGQWRTARDAMNAAFGGSGMAGAERAADCMARALGATWTHHTSCSSSAWQAMGRRLLAGRPV